MTAIPARTQAEESGLELFSALLQDDLNAVESALRRDITLRNRIERKFSSKAIAARLGLDEKYLRNLIARMTAEEPAFPPGEKAGRERVFTLEDLLLIRAILQTTPLPKRSYLHWRRPGDPVKIVTFGSQKGGTAKSLSSAHFAQYMAMTYGMRVGVIDADPQGTATLYFADNNLNPFDPEVRTVASFMGADDLDRVRETRDDRGDVVDPGGIIKYEPAELDRMWLKTPWPGIRLIPGGPDLQTADFFFFTMDNRQKMESPPLLALRDAIERWSRAHPPTTQPEDLRKADGSFDKKAFEAACYETLDLIVIDQQPSTTLTQLTGLVAADHLVIPQTMKGFDLNTLMAFASNVYEAAHAARIQRRSYDGNAGPHIVLPTVVQEANIQDTKLIVDLRREARKRGAADLISPVFYSRSDAIANASEQYKSIYEFDPPSTRRASAKQFQDNADAVNDYLATLIYPDLPSRGHAERFQNERWG